MLHKTSENSRYRDRRKESEEVLPPSKAKDSLYLYPSSNTSLSPGNGNGSFCGNNELLLPDNVKPASELPIVPSETVDDAIPLAHIKPQSEWDDCDWAVHAHCNGEPLPTGWAVIPGVELMKVVEYEKATGLTEALKIAPIVPSATVDATCHRGG